MVRLIVGEMPGKTCTIPTTDVRISIAAPSPMYYLAASGPRRFRPHQELPLVTTPKETLSLGLCMTSLALSC